ncbi:cell division ATP-binding protein FtsE [Patescibacteria group bacterium]
MLKVQNVTKKYGNEGGALKNVTLNIEKGEFVFIVGRSGMGKSTLIKLIIGEEKPTSGKIKINKWVINELSSHQLPYYRRQIGVVFQDFRLLDKKTVRENISFAMEVSGISDETIKKKVPEMLDLVGLREKGERFPEELSGGEQQRVAIARALIHDPKMLIADEPTGNLDIHNSEEIMELLNLINMRGTTVIVATHNKQVVDAFKKRVVTIDNGQILRDEQRGEYRL